MTVGRLESATDAHDWLLGIIDRFVVEDTIMRTMGGVSDEFICHRKEHNEAHADLSTEIVKLISSMDTDSVNFMNARVREFVEGRLRQHFLGLDPVLDRFIDNNSGHGRKAAVGRRAPTPASAAARR